MVNEQVQPVMLDLVGHRGGAGVTPRTLLRFIMVCGTCRLAAEAADVRNLLG